MVWHSRDLLKRARMYMPVRFGWWRTCTVLDSQRNESYSVFEGSWKVWKRTRWPDWSLTWMSFFKESFRGLGVLPEQNCKNWSLDETELISLHYENRALLPDNFAKDIVLQDNHRSCGPFALKDPELTIVPDSCIYQVPLAALADGGDRFVSETFRIRIVPSLMTLRLTQDSPL